MFSYSLSEYSSFLFPIGHVHKQTCAWVFSCIAASSTSSTLKNAYHCLRCFFHVSGNASVPRGRVINETRPCSPHSNQASNESRIFVLSRNGEKKGRDAALSPLITSGLSRWPLSERLLNIAGEGTLFF